MGIVANMLATFPLTNTPSFKKDLQVDQHLHLISHGTQNFQFCSALVENRTCDLSLNILCEVLSLPSKWIHQMTKPCLRNHVNRLSPLPMQVYKLPLTPLRRKELGGDQ